MRTGRPAHQEKFGRPFGEDLAANPELKASFDALMGPQGHGVPDQDIELTEGWEKVSAVVDLGSGTGAFLAQLLCRHPTVRGTLVDLPPTGARSAAIFEEAGVADRVTTFGRSFFEALPAGADLYGLKKILNDWTDRETVVILRRCAEAASPADRVVVPGGVSPDNAPVELTIEMVLLGARTSSVAVFRNLARQAGAEAAAGSPRPDGRFVVDAGLRVAAVAGSGRWASQP